MHDSIKRKKVLHFKFPSPGGARICREHLEELMYYVITTL